MKERSDFLIVGGGVGVVPDTDYLGTSGLHLDNGVQVNEYFEASLPHVYAAGDLANFFDPLYGRHRRIEHWDTAIQQGKVAGANMAGQRTTYAAVSSFYSDVFDVSFEYFGDAMGTTGVIQRGSFDKRSVTLCAGVRGWQSNFTQPTRDGRLSRYQRCLGDAG